MATDATGTPTALGIPKFNVDADPPSGLGFNAAMDEIDALLQARVGKPAGLEVGDIPVWNGSGWVRPSGSPNAAKILRGDSTWSQVVRGHVNSDGTILSGVGFSATRTGAGRYTITPTTAFSSVPAVVVTRETTAALLIMTAFSVTDTSFGVASDNTSGVATDAPFFFIALES